MENNKISSLNSSGHGEAGTEAGALAPGEPGPANTSATIGAADSLGIYIGNNYAAEPLRQQRFSRMKQSSKWLIADALRKERLEAEQSGGDVPDWVKPIRVAKCHWRATSAIVDVYLKKTEYGNFAFYRNIETCRSIWACCYCSSRIRNQRAKELQVAFKNIIEDKSLSIGIFATFTVKHQISTPLSLSLQTLQAAYSYMRSTRAWRRLMDRIGYIGIIRATEVTYGSNGFNPHFHCWIILDRRLSSATIEAVEAEMSEMWIAAVKKKSTNKSLVPSKKRGVDLRRVTTQGFTLYISKGQQDIGKGHKRNLAVELTRFDLKQGRLATSITPFEMLDRNDMAPQWCEYVDATKGKRASAWSRGLKQRLGLTAGANETDSSNGNPIFQLSIPFRDFAKMTAPELNDLLSDVEQLTA